eukprot:scaffold60549_cov20-Tisochrysis_lutea.AAC.1
MVQHECGKAQASYSAGVTQCRHFTAHIHMLALQGRGKTSGTLLCLKSDAHASMPALTQAWSLIQTPWHETRCKRKLKDSTP